MWESLGLASAFGLVLIVWTLSVLPDSKDTRPPANRWTAPIGIVCLTLVFALIVFCKYYYGSEV